MVVGARLEDALVEVDDLLVAAVHEVDLHAFDPHRRIAIERGVHVRIEHAPVRPQPQPDFPVGGVADEAGQVDRRDHRHDVGARIDHRPAAAVDVPALVDQHVGQAVGGGEVDIRLDRRVVHARAAGHRLQRRAVPPVPCGLARLHPGKVAFRRGVEAGQDGRLDEFSGGVAEHHDAPRRGEAGGADVRLHRDPRIVEPRRQAGGEAERTGLAPGQVRTRIVVQIGVGDREARIARTGAAGDRHLEQVVRANLRRLYRVVFALVAGVEASEVEPPAAIIRGEREFGQFARQPEVGEGGLDRQPVAEGDAVVIGAEHDLEPPPCAAGLGQGEREFVIMVARGGRLSRDQAIARVDAGLRRARDRGIGTELLVRLECETERGRVDHGTAVERDRVGRSPGGRILADRDVDRAVGGPEMTILRRRHRGCCKQGEGGEDLHRLSGP